MNRRGFLTRLLAVPLAPVAFKIAKLFNPSLQRIACIRPMGTVSLLADRVAGIEPRFISVPTFPLYSNPVISLDEIKSRRFQMKRYDNEMVAAYTGLERPGVGTIKHWPEWKFELWDRKTT
jgi:hypothetical protein